MTDLAPFTARAAAQSLLAFWEAAGVDALAPIAGGPAPPHARAAAPERAPATESRPAPGPSRLPPRGSAAAPADAKTTKPPAQDAREMDARAIAARCMNLDALAKALGEFDHPLRATARNTVFARGDRNADVMLIGEAPGREEDLEGLPFVGRSGQLLDRMFAEIGLTAEKGLYITNVVNWRPRNNNTPSEQDISLCRPFIERHVALKKPKLLVFAGGVSAQTMLATTQGITRLRGKWMTYKVRGPDPSTETIPAMPIFHPAFVLRRPIAKREVWRDLLALEERLKALS